MPESEFHRQMLYLKRHFRVVSLSEALSRMRNDEVNGPTAIITFDDGYQNNYDVAFPILSELKLPATVFLVTSLVDTDDTVWFCRINRAVSRTRLSSLTWGGVDYDLSSASARASASAHLQERLKKLAHDDLLTAVGDIVRMLGDNPTGPIEPDSPYRMLRQDAIRTMGASGLIEFGAHSVTHSILTRIPEDRQREEIELSVRQLGRLTDTPCTYFAYPNGGAEDYDSNAMSILSSVGVNAALTTISGPNRPETPPLELRRYGVGAGIPIAVFECMVHHLLHRLR